MRFLGVLLVVTFGCGAALAQGIAPVALQPAPQPPVQPPPPAQPEPAPAAEPTAEEDSGLGMESGLTRNLFGDFGGFRVSHFIFVKQTQTITRTETPLKLNNQEQPVGPPFTQTGTKTVIVPVQVFDPVAARAGSGFKIADNASPVPTDRFFFTYNYFNNLGGLGGDTSGVSNTSTIFTPGTKTDLTFATPTTTLNSPHTDVHRELFGFEKTFLNGNASVEVRVPLYQSVGGDDSFGSDGFGDGTVILKYALFNDRGTGNVFSTGLGVTAPTSHGIELPDGGLHDWLLQPFVGGVYHFGPAYVHGFTSVVVPTDSRDVTLLFNDFGVGYNLYQTRPGASGFLTSITPTLEVHVTTPLNHRSTTDLIQVPDIVSFTSGVHFGVGPRSTFSMGVNVPVTGPNPYDIEALVQYNFRF